MEAGIFKSDIPAIPAAEKRRKRFFAVMLAVSFVFHIGVMSFIPKFGDINVPPQPQIFSFQLDFVTPPAAAAPAAKETEEAPQPPEIIKQEQIRPNVEAVKKSSAVPKKTKTVEKTGNSKSQQSNAESSVIPIIRNASIRAQNPPVYPASARRMGQEGTVLIHALIDTDGSIGTVKVVSSSGVQSLDNSAVKAVGSWIFDAPAQNGRTVKAWVEVPVRFVLRAP